MAPIIAPSVIDIIWYDDKIITNGIIKIDSHQYV